MNNLSKLLLIGGLIMTTIGFAQKPKITNVKKIIPEKSYENVTIQELYSDENSSYFIIWIKKDVVSHAHKEHSEGIIVLEGEGVMTVGKETFDVKLGDHFVIPKNVYHSVKVTSDIPLKVISVQSPKFEGKDRVFEKKNNG